MITSKDLNIIALKEKFYLTKQIFSLIEALYKHYIQFLTVKLREYFNERNTKFELYLFNFKCILYHCQTKTKKPFYES